MPTTPRDLLAALLLLVPASLPMTAVAADEACTGITQKCTVDKPYDKTIGSTVYSCYDCKQALCKDGGNGGLSGTATSSVCTEKATTFQPISLDDQFRGGDTLAPKPASPKRPGSDLDPRNNAPLPGKVSTRQRASDRPAQFDEADALFGKRTNPASSQSLRAPSDLTIPTASRTTLTLSWRDNSTDEFGIELYRADPVEARRNPENAWKFIGTFQERNIDKVSGTGMRLDEDGGLSPGVQYCYRMRAYSGFERTQVSGFSEVTCAETTNMVKVRTIVSPSPTPAPPTPVPYPSKAPAPAPMVQTKEPDS